MVFYRPREVIQLLGFVSEFDKFSLAIKKRLVLLNNPLLGDRTIDRKDNRSKTKKWDKRSKVKFLFLLNEKKHYLRAEI